MEFELDVEELRKNTILSADKFDKRLQQVQEGGFIKKEAELYLLGMLSYYTPRFMVTTTIIQVSENFNHATQGSEGGI